MRLPDFLIVGAQRCGTSTLYEDLLDAPDIFLPAVKEPYNLCDDHVLTDAGRAEYAALFARARPGDRCGEASTRYTLRPHYEGCAERARAVLGPDVRIIYLVREPIARAISHYRFDFAHGWVSADADRELLHHARYVNAGRYAFQITPWIETFGLRQVHIERFEDFIHDRPAALGRLCGFLGVSPPARVEATRAVNASAELRPVTGAAARVATSGLYQRLRPMIPRQLRARLRRSALPPPPRTPPPRPAPATVQALVEKLAPEAEGISRILTSQGGGPGPVWDLEAAVGQYRSEGEPPAASPGPTGSVGAASGKAPV